MTPSYSSFTPLESLLFFQSILQHGVEAEAFSRISSVLQSNPFVRSDDRYNATRLTADSLKTLFLEEVGGDSIDFSVLPPLIERLYLRYRDHIVCAIREDEGLIEKMQIEIRQLEKQAAGGSGRGARASDARAAEAKVVVEQHVSQQQVQQHQQHQQQHHPAAIVSTAFDKSKSPAPAVTLPRSTSMSASIRPATSTSNHHAAFFSNDAPATTPLLPATAPFVVVSSVTALDRLVNSPRLPHQRQQQQQQKEQQQKEQQPKEQQPKEQQPKEQQPKEQQQKEQQQQEQQQHEEQQHEEQQHEEQQHEEQQHEEQQHEEQQHEEQQQKEQQQKEQQQQEQQQQEEQQQEQQQQEQQQQEEQRQEEQQQEQQQQEQQQQEEQRQEEQQQEEQRQEQQQQEEQQQKEEQQQEQQQQEQQQQEEQRQEEQQQEEQRQEQQQQEEQQQKEEQKEEQQSHTTRKETHLQPTASFYIHPIPSTTSKTPTEPPQIGQKFGNVDPAGQCVTSQSASQQLSLQQMSTSSTPSQLLHTEFSSLQTGRPFFGLATPRPHALTAQMSEPHSLSPTTFQTNVLAAQQPIVPPIGHAKMPGPVAAAQKLTPIAPVPPAPHVSQIMPGTPGPHGASVFSFVSRPPLLEPIRGKISSKSSTPVQMRSSRTISPYTPVSSAAAATVPFPRGSGTRWKPSDPTPSTPGPDVGDIASPAYEPLSPAQSVRRLAEVAESDDDTDDNTIQKTLQSMSREFCDRPLYSTHGWIDGDVARPVKAETFFPRLLDGHNEEEDLIRKRKRAEKLIACRRLVGTPTPPTHVLWMRGFPKISASALDQISSHRHANMFAHKIRDRDAPGYGSIVRHPVDLKSIRMAITQGNKAAFATSVALGESSENSIWLPISEDLVPPRGIINSSQLECELVHMFANAIMYNPDSHRGVGTAFLVEDDVSDDDDPSSSANPDASSSNVRYQVDEDGVVKDTRSMYIEVEKLLSDMRSAERQQGMPPPPTSAEGLDLRSDLNEEAEYCGDDEDVEDTQIDEDPDGIVGTSKRRRITRG
ncbi:hypothetical protein SEPCBS119000_006564 [Sporothrix epigloea]|uniref:Bromo domain-containing protein n=1 Tax=Sporothrix epigloea TaxID=1892477 RepID=A0ABP0E3M3_9PEZI